MKFFVKTERQNILNEKYLLYNKNIEYFIIIMKFFEMINIDKI